MHIIYYYYYYYYYYYCFAIHIYWCVTGYSLFRKYDFSTKHTLAWLC